MSRLLFGGSEMVCIPVGLLCSTFGMFGVPCRDGSISDEVGRTCLGLFQAVFSHFCKLWAGPCSFQALWCFR